MAVTKINAEYGSIFWFEIRCVLVLIRKIYEALCTMRRDRMVMVVSACHAM